jgi:hypothetical protein
MKFFSYYEQYLHFSILLSDENMHRKIEKKESKRDKKKKNLIKPHFINVHDQ